MEKPIHAVTASDLRSLFHFARNGTRFFSVEFIKRDETLRRMTIRPRTGAGLKGGSRTWDPYLYNSRFVAEVIRGRVQWRPVNLSTLQSVTWEGRRFVLATDTPPVKLHKIPGLTYRVMVCPPWDGGVK